MEQQEVMEIGQELEINFCYSKILENVNVTLELASGKDAVGF